MGGEGRRSWGGKTRQAAHIWLRLQFALRGHPYLPGSFFSPINSMIAAYEELCVIMSSNVSLSILRPLGIVSDRCLSHGLCSIPVWRLPYDLFFGVKNVPNCRVARA